jgi:hypothetical protein
MRPQNSQWACPQPGLEPRLAGRAPLSFRGLGDISKMWRGSNQQASHYATLQLSLGEISEKYQDNPRFPVEQLRFDSPLFSMFLPVLIHFLSLFQICLYNLCYLDHFFTTPLSLRYCYVFQVTLRLLSLLWLPLLCF